MEATERLLFLCGRETSHRERQRGFGGRVRPGSDRVRTRQQSKFQFASQFFSPPTNLTKSFFLQTILESDSGSSDCSEAEVTNFTPPNKINKPLTVADFLRKTSPRPNMTSLESITAQLAASLNGFPPIYPGE